MSLDRRLLLLFLVISTPLVLVLWGGTKLLLESNLREVESSMAESRFEQLQNILDQRVNEMSVWGDAWSLDQRALEFVQHPSQAFIDAHLPDYHLRYNATQLVMLFNADKEQVFGRFFPFSAEQGMAVPVAIQAKVNELLINSEALTLGESMVGVSLLESDPAIYVAHRLYGNRATPLEQAGYVVFAHYLQPTFAERVHDALDLEVSVKALRSGVEPTASQFTEQAIVLSKVLYGLKPGERFEIKTQLPRELYLKGSSAIRNYFLLTCFIVLLALLALSVFVRKFVSQPIHRLFSKVTSVDLNRPLFVPEDTGGVTEVSALSYHFQALIGALFAEKSRAQTTLAAIGEAVLATDNAGVLTYVSPVAEQTLGVNAKESVGLPIDQVVELQDEGRTFSWFIQRIVIGTDTGGNRCISHLRAGSRTLVVEKTITPILDCDKRVTGTVLVLRDVSRAELLKAKMRHPSSLDSITGLLSENNFVELMYLLEEELNDSQHALCYIDLHQFTRINQVCGAAIGDGVLRDVADTIRTLIRDSDILGRMDSDEFALLLRGLDRNNAPLVIDKIAEGIAKLSLSWEGEVFDLTPRIGVSFIRDDQRSFELAMDEARQACELAKTHQAAGEQICYFNASLQPIPQRQRINWEHRLRRALVDEQFELLCLPYLPSGEGLPTRVEVLLRLRDEHEQLLRPKVFLSEARRYHLMPQIDFWVVERAFAWLARQRVAQDQLVVTVNLAAETLLDERLIGTIYKLRRKYRISARSVSFDITETAVIRSHAKVVEVMRRLRLEGFTFALDDFGSGYSAYGYLKELPIDMVKIDGAYVRTMHVNPRDYALVKSICDVGKALGLVTVAERVENSGVLDCVQRLGIDYAQGFVDGQPKPLDQFQPEQARRSMAVG